MKNDANQIKRKYYLDVIPTLEGKGWIAEGVVNTSFGQALVCFTSKMEGLKE
ncbi:MAG TPA: hypothetical protein VG098_04035 [Nitrososphaera sp.]|nr:hypothetical protein [Nitrososphaera sp.]